MNLGIYKSPNVWTLRDKLYTLYFCCVHSFDKNDPKYVVYKPVMIGLR